MVSNFFRPISDSFFKPETQEQQLNKNIVKLNSQGKSTLEVLKNVSRDFFRQAWSSKESRVTSTPFDLKAFQGHIKTIKSAEKATSDKAQRISHSFFAPFRASTIQKLTARSAELGKMAEMGEKRVAQHLLVRFSTLTPEEKEFVLKNATKHPEILETAPPDVLLEAGLILAQMQAPKEERTALFRSASAAITAFRENCKVHLSEVLASVQKDTAPLFAATYDIGPSKEPSELGAHQAALQGATEQCMDRLIHHLEQRPVSPDFARYFKGFNEVIAQKLGVSPNSDQAMTMSMAMFANRVWTPPMMKTRGGMFIGKTLQNIAGKAPFEKIEPKMQFGFPMIAANQVKMQRIANLLMGNP